MTDIGLTALSVDININLSTFFFIDISPNISVPKIDLQRKITGRFKGITNFLPFNKPMQAFLSGVGELGLVAGFPG